MTVLLGLDFGAEPARALCVRWMRQKIVSKATPRLHPNLHPNAHHCGPCSGITGECRHQRAVFFQPKAG
jgi:hypothetical protein